MHRTQMFLYPMAVTVALALGTGVAFAAPADTGDVAAAPRGTVTIERGFNLSCYNAIPASVLVNGTAVDAIGAGQTVTLRVLPGHYRIALALGEDGAVDTASQGVALTVTPGGSTALFASLGPGGSTLRALNH